MTPSPQTPHQSAGVAYGFGAYALWGFLPLYFALLAPTGPWETLAWRVLLSLILCALLVAVTRGWGRLIAILRDWRLTLWAGAAGLLIYANWQAFLVASLSGHVLQASLGYFINPIATIVLAVLVLGERLRTLQWCAVGVAALAVVVIVVFYGSVPWISFIVSTSFALYGLVKKKHLGARVDAVSGLFLETGWLAPVAAVQLVIVATTTGITFGQHGAWHTVLLSFAGLVTAVPLLMFTAASRRVSLTTIGLLQFAAPILQFVVGAFILGEEMPPERWAGFGLIWVACALLAVDLLREGNRTRRQQAIGEIV